MKSRWHQQSASLRRLAYLGARHGPEFFVRGSPPLIGMAFAAALPEVRAKVRQNLRLVQGARPALEEERAVWRTFRNYAACLTEALGAARPDRREHVVVHGEPHLRDGLGRGGMILVTAHVGPWDSAAGFLRPRLGADVMIVMEREPNEAAREQSDRAREASGVRVLHVGGHPTDALPLIRHLRAGGVAALQLDRVPPSGRAVDVSVFGAPFRVPEGPFRLAALSGVPVVPLFARRRGYFDYELSVAPPIPVSRQAESAEIRDLAQRAADEMAAFIRVDPTQWFHF